MQVGNARYLTAADLPETVPVFPISGVLLLPGGQLPLNIFEPRYLAMLDAAMSGNRLIGMIQPAMTEVQANILPERPQLAPVGCLGRITSFTETGDGRYIVSLAGVCRFRLMDEPGACFRVITLTLFTGENGRCAQVVALWVSQ